MNEQWNARQRLKEETRTQIASELKHAALDPEFQRQVEQTSFRTGSDPIEDATRAVKSKIRGLLDSLNNQDSGDATRTKSDPT